jgi:hypothetical protein
LGEALATQLTLAPASQAFIRGIAGGGLLNAIQESIAATPRSRTTWRIV